jgi:protein TonB
MGVMAVHADILEQRESLGKPLIGSIAFHALVFSLVLVYHLVPGSSRELWGDPNSFGGGTVAITPVSRLPMPARGGIVNPVANDTESQVPAPPPKPKPEVKRAPETKEKAIPLKSHSTAKKKLRPPPPSKRSSRVRGEDQPNQLYSQSGAAVSSPMFGSTSGSGGVGVGSGSPFGGRFGYYEQILRERVASKWRTDQVDPLLRTAPPVIVVFQILRDGSVRDIRFLQRSGNMALDYSAQRAITEASPFPPLPAGFDKDVANIEFWFLLKR